MCVCVSVYVCVCMCVCVCVVCVCVWGGGIMLKADCLGGWNGGKSRMKLLLFLNIVYVHTGLGGGEGRANPA